MSKHYPKELQNLSESKARVMKNVESQLEKSNSSNKLKKFFVAFSTVAVIAASSLFIINEVKQQPTDTPLVTAPLLEAGEYDALLKQYFAADNTLKIMTGTMDYFGYQFIETKWLNEQYVAEYIRVGSERTAKFYRISNNEIQLLETEGNAENYTIDQLNKLPIAETILKYDGKNFVSTDDWQVEMDYSGYFDLKDIVLIRQKDNEQQTFTKAFAKNMGLIYEMHVVDSSADNYEAYSSSLLKYQSNVWDEKRNFFKIVDAPILVSDNETWLQSPDQSLEVVNSGLVDFEGSSKLLVRDVATGKINYYFLNPEQELQETVKDVEWLSNKHVLITIGPAYGTITQGGQLYMLNIITSELTPVLVDSTGLSEVTRINRAGNEIQFEKFVYHSTEYDYEDAHEEKGGIQLLDAQVLIVEPKRIQVVANGAVPVWLPLANDVYINANKDKEVTMLIFNEEVIAALH